jgi:LPXTG-site transpeptidase (sortase) family protein
MATDDKNPGSDPAADLIRKKLDRVYNDEPDADQELAEAKQGGSLSKHQQYMLELGNSGKDLAAIQTEWHEYYQKLPDDEKKQVWDEFYSSQSLLTGGSAHPQAVAEHKHEAAKPKKIRDVRSKKEIQQTIRNKVSAGGKLNAKHHLQSLLFGLGMGFVVVIIFLFGFFNEVVIAPFIQPSRVNASTPLIVSSDSVAPTATPEVIIPKINVEIPADYSQASNDEAVIEGALENGIVHYPGTSLPGQTGNAAFFGHSSNNIFNKGKYKFAFVLLHNLAEGDNFYLTYNGKVYVYKVISRKIVDPSEVGVLNPVPGQTATATLITCDPPGTSLHRLVVVGQQISPDPTGNSKNDASTIAAAPTDQLPGNGPTLFGRVFSTAIGKAAGIALILAAFFLTVRWINAPLRHAGL